MTQRSTPSIFSLFPVRSSFFHVFAAGLATAALIGGSSTLRAQSTAAAPPAQAGPAANDAGAAAPQADVSLTNEKHRK